MKSRKVLGAVLMIGFMTAAACSSKQKEADLRPLPPPSDDVTTTTVIDFSTVQLAGVSGRTTTTSIPLGPGGASISGTVNGPNGPVPGATVHVERLVDDAVGATDVATNGAGQFVVPNVLGGRYRLRAFVPDPVDLAQTQPMIFFLGGTEQKSVTLPVNLYTGVSVTFAVAPNPPVTGEQSQLVVQVTTQSVDPKGVVRGQAVPNAKVEMYSSGSWRSLSDNPSYTGGNGRAAFVMQCGSDGPQGLTAVVNDSITQPFDVPGCVEPPPTTTTETPTTSELASTTTTAPPLLRGSTTTTTAHKSTTTTTAKKGGNGTGSTGGSAGGNTGTPGTTTGTP